MLSCPFQRRIGGLEGKGPAVASQPAEAGNIVWGPEPGSRFNPVEAHIGLVTVSLG